MPPGIIVTVDVEVSEDLIALKCAAGDASQALAEHVRANDPTRAWSSKTLARGVVIALRMEARARTGGEPRSRAARQVARNVITEPRLRWSRP